MESRLLEVFPPSRGGRKAIRCFFRARKRLGSEWEATGFFPRYSHFMTLRLLEAPRSLCQRLWCFLLLLDDALKGLAPQWGCDCQGLGTKCDTLKPLCG